jgi:bifunctional non-homologous end joining protein LigD
MQRFPNGIDSQGFMQQSIADYFPNWVDRVPLEKKDGGSITHVVCDNAATLVYLACVTPHIWLSRAKTLNYPDKMVPGPGSFRGLPPGQVWGFGSQGPS